MSLWSLVCLDIEMASCSAWAVTTGWKLNYSRGAFYFGKLASCIRLNVKNKSLFRSFWQPHSNTAINSRRGGADLCTFFFVCFFFFKWGPCVAVSYEAFVRPSELPSSSPQSSAAHFNPLSVMRREEKKVHSSSSFGFSSRRAPPDGWNQDVSDPLSSWFENINTCQWYQNALYSIYKKKTRWSLQNQRGLWETGRKMKGSLTTVHKGTPPPPPTTEKH